MTSAAVARKYRVSTRWLYKLCRQRDETGDIAPRRGRTGPPRALAACENSLAELVRQAPDATLEELRGRLSVPVSVTTVWGALKRLGVTLKKK
jgi:transposase